MVKIIDMPIEYMGINKLTHNIDRLSRLDSECTKSLSQQEDKFQKELSMVHEKFVTHTLHQSVSCATYEETFVDTKTVIINKFTLKYYENAYVKSEILMVKIPYR